jgi:hypothetical protein
LRGMIGWLKRRGALATFATTLAIVATRRQRRLLLYRIGPDNPLQCDIAGKLGNESWGHRVSGFWVPPCRYRADGRASG